MQSAAQHVQSTQLGGGWGWVGAWEVGAWEWGWVGVWEVGEVHEGEAG